MKCESVAGASAGAPATDAPTGREMAETGPIKVPSGNAANCGALRHPNAATAMSPPGRLCASRTAAHIS